MMDVKMNTTVFMCSSSHPSHSKNSIPFSQFLRLRRLYETVGL